VEARLRQLEGKQLGGEAAKPRGLPGAEKYDAARQTGGGGGATLGQAKAYNADADVAMEDGEKKKKKKKVRRCEWVGRKERQDRGSSCGKGSSTVAPSLNMTLLAITHPAAPAARLQKEAAAAEEPAAAAEPAANGEEKKKKKKKREAEEEPAAAEGGAEDGEKKVRCPPRLPACFTAVGAAAMHVCTCVCRARGSNDCKATERCAPACMLPCVQKKKKKKDK
jgi:hypothetical protein